MSASALMQKLKQREREGSKPRCHWLTHGSRRAVADRLTELAKPWGTVSEKNYWMPGGFCQLKEARLNDKEQNLVRPAADRNKLRKWWLAVGSNTPKWDIAATCTVGEEKGLLLVEAKAHEDELDADGKKFQISKASPNSCKNHQRIGEAIKEANAELTAQTGLRWALSRNEHYQMSNRFAWAWKLTELGYHVILVYLGFLNAQEMSDIGMPFADENCWEECVKKHSQPQHSQPLFPTEVWNRKWTLHGRVFVPCIRSRTMKHDAPI